MRNGGLWRVMLIALAAVSVPPSLQAADEVRPKSYLDGMAIKLGRGAANLLTGPAEFIRVPSLTASRDGGVAGLTVGLVQGAKAFVVRELAGAFEVVTFFIEIPDGFQPLVTPEFVYAHGDWAE